MAVPVAAPSAAMSSSMKVGIGLLNLAEGLLAFVLLVWAYGFTEQIANTQAAAKSGELSHQTVAWWGPDFSLTVGMAVIVLGAASGLVGSMIQQSKIFAERAGNDRLQEGFIWWYVLRPVWSLLLGGVAVVAFNADLIQIGDKTSSSGSITVLVAIGCVAGLFTDQILQKLRKLLGATDTDKFVVPSNQPAPTPA